MNSKEYLERWKREKGWRRRDKVKVRAQSMARRRVRLAKECEFCGSTKNLERHHPDYQYPEVVVTCCRSCHAWLGSEENG